MKKAIRIFTVVSFFALIPVLTMAQPPHPNSPVNGGGGNAPNTGGQTNAPVGGGAPIDGGLSILMLMGAAYGARKVYQVRK
jgi:hypothetical protein